MATLKIFGSDDYVRTVSAFVKVEADLLAETCNMLEIGDVASLWNCLAPDPTSSFPTLHRLDTVTFGRHEDGFAVIYGRVTAKRIEGSHVILDLLGLWIGGMLEVLCPMDQSGDLLAATCNMLEVGDLAYLWDGLAPDSTSDFPTLHRLTSVTLGVPTVELFVDGFESGDLLAWSSSRGRFPEPASRAQDGRHSIRFRAIAGSI